MALTDRDMPMLTGLARHLILSRPRIQQLYYPDDTTGRITRRRTQLLSHQGYLNKKTFSLPNVGPSVNLFMIGSNARLTLAEHHNDESYFLKPLGLSQPMHLAHYLEVAEVSIALHAAIEAQDKVILEMWCNEEEIVNVTEADSDKHFKLSTIIQANNPRIVCEPDAAFVLRHGNHAAVFYIERERGTNSPNRVAKLKSKQYAELVRRKLHKTHFAQTTLDRFSVLCIGEGQRHREALRKAFAKHDESTLWRFAAKQDLKPETFLFEPIWHRCDSDEPRSLVKL